MRRNIQRRCRGVVLVTAMWIIIALAAVVLVLCREMYVESMITKHEISQAKADAAELGVEQFVLSAIAGDVETPGYLGSINMQQRELGDCYFWILKTNPNDEQTPAYGLTAEDGKLDLNYITYNELMLLPNMTDAAASSILDWRSLSPTDISPSLTGQEDSYYTSTYGYHAKNAPFETVDELRLVDGVAGQIPEILYDADINHDGIIEPNELAQANTGDSFDTSMCGIMPCLTVYGVNASNSANATSSVAGTNGNNSAGNVASVNAMVDVNNATNLRNLFTQYGLTAPGGTAPTGGYKSVFDWAVAAANNGMTTADISQVYLQLTCIPTSGGTVGGGGGRGGGGGGAATTPPPKTPLVNINEASEATLVALGFQDSDAQTIMAYRATNNADPSRTADISWLLDLLTDHSIFTTPNLDGNRLSALITGSCAVYSADIVTVSRDGRAFKRVKIVVDASTMVTDPDSGLITGGSPQVVYRRDLSDEGWPLDPQIRDALRSGKPIDQFATN